MSQGLGRPFTWTLKITPSSVARMHYTEASKLSVKSQTVNSFSFAGHTVSITTTQLWPCTSLKKTQENQRCGLPSLELEIGS